MKFKVLEGDGGRARIVEFGKKYLFVSGEEITEDFRKFKSLEFKGASEQGQMGVLIYSENYNILKSLCEFLNLEELPLYDAINLMHDSLKKVKFDYLKFRGDMAELIFLNKMGGSKIFDGASADINIDGRMIEIKSFSPQKKTITISLQQLMENTEKFAIKLKISNNGLSMCELIDVVKGNSDFKEYLFANYSVSPFWNLKYELVDPVEITDLLPNIDFPSSVLGGELVVSIAK